MAAGACGGGGPGAAMAYRGQGQKVQKVMVQPIVSFCGGAGRGLRGGERRVGAALRVPGRIAESFRP